jgi:hypothetical protein
MPPVENSRIVHKWEILAVLAGLHTTCLLGAQSAPAQAQAVREKARQAAQEGKIAYKLATPEELKELLGPPANEKKGSGWRGGTSDAAVP